MTTHNIYLPIKPEEGSVKKARPGLLNKFILANLGHLSLLHEQGVSGHFDRVGRIFRPH